MKKIAISEDAYIREKLEFEVPNGDTTLKLYAHELGYLDIQTLRAKAVEDKENPLQPLALIVAESVKDAEGNQFTYDEVLRLKKSVSEPLLDAVIKVNALGTPEKN